MHFLLCSFCSYRSNVCCCAILKHIVPFTCPRNIVTLHLSRPSRILPQSKHLTHHTIRVIIPFIYRNIYISYPSHCFNKNSHTSNMYDTCRTTGHVSTQNISFNHVNSKVTYLVGLSRRSILFPKLTWFCPSKFVTTCTEVFHQIKNFHLIHETIQNGREKLTKTCRGVKLMIEQPIFKW